MLQSQQIFEIEQTEFTLSQLKTDSYNDIPIELQQLNNWIVWRLESRDGKNTKIPYNVNGGEARSNDANTWSSFVDAVTAARTGRYNGIGFMFTQNDEYIGIDIDNCYENGVFNEVATSVIDSLDSYTEFSPSKTGVHLIVKGKMPDWVSGTGKKSSKYGIEIYSYGRYFTFTGDRENGNEIQERTDEVAKLLETYFTRDEMAAFANVIIPQGVANKEEDSVTWQRMFNSKQGEKIQAMYRGELIIDNDHSSTDLSLCNYLAFWCNKDFWKMDRMFRQSGLMRDKWDERRGELLYGEITLIKAISTKKETVSEYANKNELLAQEIDSLIFPKGYISKNGCLYNILEKKDRNGEVEEIEILICRQTPIITRSFMNVEFSQLYHELAWSDKGRGYKEVIPAGDLAIKKELLKLSYKSLAVTDNNAKHLITYFDRLNMVNHLDHEHLVERLGHIKNTFVHPLKADNVTILPPDIGEKQLLEAFQSSGTSNEWIENVFKPIKKHPKALLMVLASFTSILLQDLKMKPFIIDLSGVTSQGKTTVLRACASVWGTEHLVSEWSLTKVAAERKASFLNSFPIILDDTRKADEKQLQGFIYAFSGGRSKGRGSISGSQREFTWGNLLLSTGEDSLNDYAERAGGVAARILPITGLPFEGENYQFFSNLYNAIENYYGSIGLEFVSHWNEKKNTVLQYFSEYNDIFQKKSQGNEVISRIARYYAAIVYTGRLLNEFFNLEIDLFQLYRLFDELNAENKAVDKPMQLLEAILSDLDADRGAVYGEYLPHSVTKAVYKNGTIYLLPSYLKDFLKSEQNTIRNEWLRRGICIESINNGSVVDYQQIKHKGRKFRGVAIQPKIIEELGFNFEEKG
ncbi:DUF927 domain-containing protein [Lysinibacillus sphaericus]|uniref:Uncharacterized protein n=3 Tax=Lysinibacillus TaxID=400634 RepID=B1HX57_LYSSC|nr:MULTISPECIES: DUF927 domain-containing protein [Lysinibacillus]MBE5084613.1 DUF927 domain-containing protein [Bacillus thuringiensis]ACA41633.1 conserved hypothetical protein [Lysinibacillus sphaericus C3-41]AMO32504.1 hypothetical protein AR327_08710 [Lysinibacillus sphaericus]AMR92395.1 hypothetical protein A1T07_20500 [Lysinibacillus sphaericus]ANA46444.1 hypothetical protein A2J09_13170 [Lysinibacillus sphaericus]